MEVLGLACGHGRIANRLAARGCRVTGLDATPLFLDLACRDATDRGVAVE
jgi:2-polyprenyl-3-methyl-5-hydroxy-6-metoxy-1,4-benzoquinol methylase